MRSTASSSSGTSVRRSTTSAATPRSASRSAAASAGATIEPIATIDTSPPSRTVAACPNGTRCSPSGTSALRPPWVRASRNTHGSGDRSAVLSRPFASAELDGMSTLSPPRLASAGCTLSLCCAAVAPPAPYPAMIVTGMFSWPPVISRILAIWFAMASKPV
ncbi:hypothetical protein BJF78_32640 [Pseudonocardia sp. CNS-139]|nr:hypothetical protein BJF78_32640 [Pseudonocardia sp. CNS-139]